MRNESNPLSWYIESFRKRPAWTIGFTLAMLGALAGCAAKVTAEGNNTYRVEGNERTATIECDEEEVATVRNNGGAVNQVTVKDKNNRLAVADPNDPYATLVALDRYTINFEFVQSSAGIGTDTVSRVAVPPECEVIAE